MIRILCPYLFGRFRVCNVKADVDLFKVMGRQQPSWTETSLTISQLVMKSLEFGRTPVFFTPEHLHVIPLLASAQQSSRLLVELTWVDSHAAYCTYGQDAPLSEMTLASMTGMGPTDLMTLSRADVLAGSQVQVLGGQCISREERERFNLSGIRLNGYVTKDPPNRFHWVHIDTDVLWPQCQIYETSHGLPRKTVVGLLRGMKPDMVSVKLWDAVQDDGRVSQDFELFMKELQW